MKNRNMLLSFFVCAVAAVTVYGQNNTDTAAIKALKEVYAGKFLIGAAGDLKGYSDAELANIKTHYDILTPENCMKPQPTHPSEDIYNFTTPDSMVEWCQKNGVKVWGHTLLWHAQTGRWFFQGPDGQPATRELAMERLKKHIFTVVGRYKGRVIGWDVVNEAIADSGAGETENLRNRSWYKTIGPDVLTMAFKWAHEADVVLGQCLLHLPDGRRIPVAHVLIFRHLRHMLLQPAEIGERPLRDPGGAAGLLDRPVVRVHAEETDPVDDLAAHPVRGRVVDIAGHIQAGVLPGQCVHLHDLFPGVRARRIVTGELLQQRPAIGEVVRQDPVHRLPVDRLDETLAIIHHPAPPCSTLTSSLTLTSVSSVRRPRDRLHHRPEILQRRVELHVVRRADDQAAALADACSSRVTHLRADLSAGRTERQRVLLVDRCPRSRAASPRTPFSAAPGPCSSAGPDSARPRRSR